MAFGFSVTDLITSQLPAPLQRCLRRTKNVAVAVDAKVQAAKDGVANSRCLNSAPVKGMINYQVGVLAALPTALSGVGTSVVCQKLGMIPEVSSEQADELIDMAVTHLKIDPNSVRNVTCPITTIVMQFKDTCPTNEIAASILEQAHQTPAPVGVVKSTAGIMVAGYFPLMEEITYRFLLQEVILRQVPKLILGRVRPAQSHLVDHRYSKIFRIALGALVFSFMHSYNQSIMSPAFVVGQMVQTFVGGLWLGMLKESRFGFLSALGCHVGVNWLSMMRFMQRC